KPMLPLVNIPFLEIELLHLKQYGIEEVILSTGYLPSVFDEYFGDGSRLGMKLIHVTEDKPLGTCGAIKNVAEHLGGEPVIICNGDILTDLDIRALVEYHNNKKSVVTITLTPVDDPTAYGLVPLDEEGRIMEFLEKPSWDQVVTNMINAGTYVLDPAVLRDVPMNEQYSFERQLFPDLLEGGTPMYGYPSECYWLDLGTPAKYLGAHHDILEGKVNIKNRGGSAESGICLGENVRGAKNADLYGPLLVGDDVVIEEGARVGGKTCVGNGVRIGKGSNIKGSVIMDCAKIGENCLIEDSIIGRSAELGDSVQVAGCSVLGDNIQAKAENEFKNGIRVWPEVVIESGTIKF
ncbi:MAG: NDP-sugar synthase, partial [Actinobacteria bacterium]|nr:NDP-sugar synthase [Actinomycetota bacterium]